jgi:endonuclease YncB( thermonuclease family)
MRRLSILFASALALAAMALPAASTSAHRATPGSFTATIDYAVDGDTLRIREPDANFDMSAWSASTPPRT